MLLPCGHTVSAPRQRQPVIEMDVGGERNADPPLDLTQRGRRLHIQHRNANEIAPHLLQLLDLKADGGRRNRELLGCFGEALVARGRVERAKRRKGR